MSFIILVPTNLLYFEQEEESTKQALSGKQPAQNFKKNVGSDVRTSGVNMELHGGVKKKADNCKIVENNEDSIQDVRKKVEKRTVSNNENRGQNLKKKSVNSCDLSLSSEHSAQAIKRSATASESDAVMSKRRAIHDIKKKGGVSECDTVIDKENSNQITKKKAVDDRTADNKALFGKGIKNKTVDAENTTAVNKRGHEQVMKKKSAGDKNAMISSNEHSTHGVKRKAMADDRSAKHIKLDETSIINEENRRRQERDERSLFIKGLPKNTKTKELEGLCSDIETVRHLKGSSFAWIVFSNEASCNKAYGELSNVKVGGKELTVDFCGSKSSRKPHNPKESLPVNPLELYINGLSAQVTKDELKNVFPAAVSIHIPSKRHHELRRAFVLFSSEDDAKVAFDKGRGLKLGGQSVEVFYARIRKSVITPVKQSKESNAGKKSSVCTKTEPVVVKPNENDGSDDEGYPSSNEGIEEVKQPAKKAIVQKDKLGTSSNKQEVE
ncbi:hypothetical protein DICVIV_10306, partial [Dictyocaulus viviparus]